MADRKENGKAVFRVIDALDGPHGGRLLRLRLVGGEAPTIKELKGATMLATSPDGQDRAHVRVEGFAVFGGRPTDKRLARTGRVDVHVVREDGGGPPPIGLRWEVTRADE